MDEQLKRIVIYSIEHEIWLLLHKGYSDPRHPFICLAKYWNEGIDYFVQASWDIVFS